MKKRKKAFTLIELIIVLAIMAIIAAIAIPNFTAVRDNSKNKSDVQSCLAIKRTVDMLVVDQTIAIGTQKTFIITPGTSVLGDTATAALTDYAADDAILKAQLTNVAKPQGNPTNTTSGTTSKYQIVIGTDGTVTVTTIA